MNTEVVQMIAFTVVVIAISTLSICVWRTVSLGRKCAEEGIAHMPQHKRAVNYTLLATLFLVFSIETFSFFSPDHVHMTSTLIFKIHMFFVAPFLVLLFTLRFWATGVHKKSIHKPLAYLTALFFVGVLVTGSLMLGKLMLA